MSNFFGSMDFETFLNKFFSGNIFQEVDEMFEQFFGGNLSEKYQDQVLLPGIEYVGIPMAYPHAVTVYDVLNAKKRADTRTTQQVVNELEALMQYYTQSEEGIAKTVEAFKRNKRWG